MKKEKRNDKKLADQFGIPKAFRQYAKRYGNGVHAVVQEWRKYPSIMRAVQQYGIRK
jgi:hypothetical protein